MQTSYREAKIIDIPEIINVNYITWIPTYTCLEKGISAHTIIKYIASKDPKKKEEDISNQINSADSFVYVATVENKIVGYVAVKRIYEKTGEVCSLYVLPDYQHKGIGSTLLLMAEKWLEREEIFLECVDYNLATIWFYQSFGYKIVGKGEFIRELDNSLKIETVRMIKHQNS